jgi:hypothetical protein
VNQRWRDRLGSFRDPGEPIRTADYDVVPFPRLAPGAPDAAKDFVERHHYSGSFPAARERVGLYRRGELVGVAVFSVPCRPEVLTSVFPSAEDSVELGRFVLLDEVPGNGETWFLARALRYMRAEGYCGVLSFSDPCPRTTLDGREVFAGHIGTIYQAGNATYLGTGPRRSLKLLPDGRVLSARAISKIRAKERNWRGAAETLVALGAGEPPEEDAARRAWLLDACARFTRTVRHSGNHRYAWALHKAIALPSSLSYPKRGVA